MRKKRNIGLSAIIILIFILGLTGCASKDKRDKDSNNLKNSTEIDSHDIIPEEKGKVSSQIEVTDIISREVSGSKTWYNILYRLNDEEEKLKGYMTTDGIVSTEKPKGLYETMFDSNEFILYDKNGNETYTYPGEKRVIILGAVDTGVYLVEEINKGIDGYTNYLGLMDSKGEWKEGKVNLQEATGSVGAAVDSSSFENLGEGMLGAYWRGEDSNFLFVFDTETEKVLQIPSVWQPSLDFGFSDGTMIFQRYEDERLWEISSVDKNGTITTLLEEGELIDVGENGFLTDFEGLSFYNRKGELAWSFNDYEVSSEFSPFLYDDKVIVGLEGKDGWTYVGCLLQESGEFAYEPIIKKGSVYGHLMVTDEEFVDLLNGKTIAEVEEDFSADEIENYWDGLFFVKDRDRVEKKTVYRFYDEKGKIVQPALDEK